jgi:selenocysteine lyase/cysteine desulfurase
MRSWEALPEASLKRAGEVSAELLDQGLSDYRAAARFINQLPYGRNSDRADFRLVMRERRGTCSTKHALLAALALEQKLSVHLTLGIYEMNERNTPGVGEVLERAGLASIPEAHCYLVFGAERVDVTRSLADPGEPIAQFLHEERIAPAQIGQYKLEYHQNYLRQWSARMGLRFDEVWEIRERCIGALSAPR